MLGAVSKETEAETAMGADRPGEPGPLPTDPFFELSLDMLCIAGTDGYFKRINPAFERVLGYTQEELLSRPFVEFVHPDDVASTIHEIEGLDIGQPTVLFENRYFHRSGEVRWIQWNSAAPNADGLIYAVARDITKNKKAEDDLRRYASELERSNSQLKATQEQLIQAEKMETVGRLAAGVAHEVKNPLALLLLGVNYLSGGVDPNDPHVAEILAEMTQAITRADRIVRGLVNFAEENQIHLVPVDFRVLASDVLLMMRHDFTRHSIRTKLEVAKGVPLVLADRGRLEQVLVNLITNAIQAMEGTPEPILRIRARRAELDDVARDEGVRTMDHLRDGDDVVVIEVIDNGRGIAAPDLPKLFDPFFTTKATGVGTGLGLTVTRRIVELHRGRIDIRNDPETGGARVSITLKAVARPA
jgi:PAS domain S-box-containing protein